MRIDLLQSDSWDCVCDQYRSQLPFGQDATQTIQVYRGYTQALLEVSLGIAKIFSHKKTVAIVANSEPAFESVSQVFSSDGYTVVALGDQELQNPECWFEEHKDELLFVLFAEDDPVTGRILETAALNAFFKEKRIFRILLSHASFRCAPLVTAQPFEARVLSMHPERALLIAGSRCKLRPVFTPQMPWRQAPEPALKSDLQIWSEPELGEMMDRVLQFEAAPPAPFHSCFNAKETRRVYDRVLLSSDEFDGFSVTAALAAKAGQMMASQPKHSSQAGTDLTTTYPFATMSPCLWQSERLVDWRKKLGETENEIRGMIALPNNADLIEIRKILVETITSLRAIQEG